MHSLSPFVSRIESFLFFFSVLLDIVRDIYFIFS